MQAENVEERDEVLTSVLDIWGDILRQDVDETTSLFQLDVDSISAVRIVTRVRERLGAKLSVLDLFDSATAGEFAETVRAALAAGPGRI